MSIKFDAAFIERRMAESPEMAARCLEGIDGRSHARNGGSSANK